MEDSFCNKPCGMEPFECCTCQGAPSYDTRYKEGAFLIFCPHCENEFYAIDDIDCPECGCEDTYEIED